MRRTNPALAFVAVAGALAVACAGTPPARHAAGAGDGAYDVRAEGTIPPPPAVPEVADTVFEAPLTEDTLYVDEAPPPVAPAPAPVDTVATVPGFRVQVFASSSEVVAQRAARSAEARLGARAHVVAAGGLYKVQLGDFRAREAAEALLRRARERFYPDAWIVETRVEAAASDD